MQKKRRRLYLVQVNQRYGDNVYLPYSVGCLWAHAQQFEQVTDAYELCDFLYLKEPITHAIQRLSWPDIVCFSSYIWNWQWNKELALHIKAIWPSCTTLAGGVHVWDESSRTLKENPQFDFAIYGEGEGALVDFLIENAKDKPDYSKCGSLVWRQLKAEEQFSGCYVVRPEIVVNPRRDPVNVNDLPSPYLTGVFDSLLPREQRWQGAQETNRGCVYSCSFCAWGASALSKLRLFPDSRVYGELDWFASNRVDFLENCDANWGIVKRDIEFTRRMVDTKARTGYPQRFRAAFAKNSNETIWQIANTLHGAGMLKAVTLAMQSMQPSVLEYIQRKNIRFEQFGSLIKRYEAAGIPTYTELIMGLPGETLETYLNGIEMNLEAGQHSGLFCYMNMLLPNTEQADPEYMKRHGLRTVPMKAMMLHGTPDPSVPVEIQETVIETDAMPHADWKKAWLFSKVVECFHCLGLLQHVAISAYEQEGIKYRQFYRWISYCLHGNPQTVAGREYANMRDLLDSALAGGSWDCVDERFGNVSWPPEEFMFLRIGMELERFYDEMAAFWGGPAMQEQRQMIVGPEPGREEEWARENVWYGRKGVRKLIKRKGEACHP